MLLAAAPQHLLSVPNAQCLPPWWRLTDVSSLVVNMRGRMARWLKRHLAAVQYGRCMVSAERPRATHSLEAHLSNHPAAVLQLPIAVRLVLEGAEAGGAADEGIRGAEVPALVALRGRQVGAEVHQGAVLRRQLVAPHEDVIGQQVGCHLGGQHTISGKGRRADTLLCPTDVLLCGETPAHIFYKTSQRQTRQNY